MITKKNQTNQENLLRSLTGSIGRTSTELSLKLEKLLVSKNSLKVESLANKCFEKYGAYPLSFSIPSFFPVNPNENQSRVNISSIIPGKIYSYDSHARYMEQYANSRYALTHKKSGWDCFRHLEIMSVGTIPIMLDADQIPKYTMVHYPKEFLMEVKKSAIKQLFPDVSLHDSLIMWAKENMSSSAMASYILKISKVEPNRILFLDEYLPKTVDYASVMTLIGFKQIFGPLVDVMYPCEYIYDDYQGDSARLYGRGFGYSRILARREFEDSLAQRNIQQNEIKELIGHYDLVIIGNVSKNPRLTKILHEAMTPAVKVYVWGDDLGRTRAEWISLQKLDGVKFVREIY